MFVGKLFSTFLRLTMVPKCSGSEGKAAPRARNPLPLDKKVAVLDCLNPGVSKAAEWL